LQIADLLPKHQIPDFFVPLGFFMVLVVDSYLGISGPDLDLKSRPTAAPSAAAFGRLLADRDCVPLPAAAAHWLPPPMAGWAGRSSPIIGTSVAEGSGCLFLSLGSRLRETKRNLDIPFTR